MDALLWTLYDVAEWVVPLAMVPVLARRHRPHVAFGWLFLLLLLPLLGLAAWLYLGVYRPHRERQRRGALRTIDRLREQVRPAAAETSLTPELAPLGRLVSRLGLAQLGGWPVVGGNRVEVIDEPGELVGRLVHDVEAAQRSVDLLFYLFAADEAGRRVADALRAAASRGVRCRVLAGAWSSRFEASRPFFPELADRLRASGVEVIPLHPLSPLRSGLARVDLRNHRKLAVLDGGTVGYTGSENVHDPDMGLAEGLWHQLSVRLEGPAARQLQLVFLHDWVLHGGELGERVDPEPAAPAADGVSIQVVWWGPADDAPAVKVWLAVLGAARERVVLATPYFVPDRPVLLALATAALRGVRVELVVPERSDQRLADAAARATFDELLEAGVHVHLHRGGVLHAKCMSVDDRLALVGSANADRRSFYLDEEVVALLYDEPVARRVRESQERWIAHARPARCEALRARPLWRRTADDVAALASPLL